MHSQRMVERALPALQLEWYRPERLLLFLIQHCHDLVHVARKPRNWQEGPLMASGDKVKAAIITRTVVERYPARQVRHRPRPRPVRVVLVPCHYTAVMRWLAEELV